MSYVTHLESTADGSHLPVGELHDVHGGKPLLVRYDLGSVRARVDPEDLEKRPPDLWKYHELLPLRDPAHRISLGETTTPLLSCPRLAAELGLTELWIKDESRLPTGSFKARGMAVAVSMAHELGVERVAVPTAGNAGGALAAYAARAGMDCYVFLPADTPIVNQYEVVAHGAHACLVDGLIHDCGAIVREHRETMSWFDMSTLREPYRIEGKKTMGLELAEQCGWCLPDVILYPTGGGTGLIGMDKAFGELRELGWLRSDTMPQLWACQAEGCAPLVEAFAAGLNHGIDPVAPTTAAAGIRVPRALGDFLVLDAVRRSEGRALSCPEAELLHWTTTAMRLEGIALCPEAGACLAVLATAVRDGQIDSDQRIVVFNTGAAQKYVEVLRTEIPRVQAGAWQPPQ